MVIPIKTYAKKKVHFIEDEQLKRVKIKQNILKQAMHILRGGS